MRIAHYRPPVLPERARPRLIGLAVVLTGVGLGSLPAVASVSPYATLDAQSNSNVFQRPSGDPPFPGSGTAGLSDIVKRYSAGAAVNFLWHREQLTLTTEFRHVDYNRFSLLNHNEYQYGGLFNWHLGPIIDGSVSYSRERKMALLADTLAAQLELNTEQTVEAKARILLNPRWRLDLIPKKHDMDTPLPRFPNFRLRETWGSAALNYLGFSKLTAGLRFDYGVGTYHGVVGATKYQQRSAELTADYNVTALSSFNGELGYTRRRSEPNPAGDTLGTLGAAGLTGTIGTTSSYTGSLGYHRQLTGKTGATLRVFRRIDSYVAGANSEIGTGAEVGLKWDPDVKLSVEVGYRYTNESIQGNLVIANTVDRRDHLRNASIGVAYAARPWLIVRPYAQRDERSSNLRIANFTATIIGISLTGRIQ